VVAQDFGGRGRPGVVPQGAMASPPPPSAPPPAAMRVRAEAATAVTGAAGVTESRRSRQQQDALQLEDVVVTGTAGQEAVRRVGARTFYQRGSVWTDAEITDTTAVPETEVEFGSEEFYALMRRIPALAQYFAQGEEVDVIHEGRRYRVRARRG
jgi:hypothetical protein